MVNFQKKQKLSKRMLFNTNMDIPVNINRGLDLNRLIESMHNNSDQRIINLIEKLIDNHNILCKTVQAMVVETIDPTEDNHDDDNADS